MAKICKILANESVINFLNKNYYIPKYKARELSYNPYIMCEPYLIKGCLFDKDIDQGPDSQEAIPDLNILTELIKNTSRVVILVPGVCSEPI